MANFTIEPNERITFNIRHADDDLLVIDKPAGVPTQPGLGHERDTLMNGLFALYGERLQNLGRTRDFGLLHRLDRWASGLLVVGLTASAYDNLREQFEGRAVGKFYWAVVMGAPKRDEGVIRKPLIEVGGRGGSASDAHAGRASGRSPKMAKPSSDGKPAITAYRVLQKAVAASLVECRPVTGRLHQIRVHMELLGCPILGDDLYGNPGSQHAAARLALHAHRIVLSHPATGAKLDVLSKWPSDLRGVLRKFNLARPDLPSAPGAGPKSKGDRDDHAEA